MTVFYSANPAPAAWRTLLPRDHCQRWTALTIISVLTVLIVLKALAVRTLLKVLTVLHAHGQYDDFC